MGFLRSFMITHCSKNILKKRCVCVCVCHYMDTIAILSHVQEECIGVCHGLCRKLTPYYLSSVLLLTRAGHLS